MTPLSDQDRQNFLSRAHQAADWFTNAQIKCPRPFMSDANRYLYYYFIPEDEWVPGLNWTHGRAMFTLSDAYNITANRKYLDSMLLAARYVKALQPMDPSQAITHGVFHEEIPQAPNGGILDGAQAASGLLMLYQLSGDSDYLRRGRAFCDFLLRTWRPDLGMPHYVEFYPEKVHYLHGGDCISQASAIPLWHCYNLTGEGQYIRVIVDAADRVLRCQRPDGAINYLDNIKLEPNPPFNHHWGLGQGDDRYILRNDDGIVTVVLAAYQATRDKRYLDSMVAYAEWIVANEPHERPYNAFGIQASNVLDIGQIANKSWLDWVMAHLQDRCLNLQVQNTNNPKADGGFRGEDEEGNSGIYGGKALDYVVTRVTTYMAGLLYRLSAQGTGTGFSVFGLKKR